MFYVLTLLLLRMHGMRIKFYSLHWPQRKTTILHLLKIYYVTYHLTENDMEHPILESRIV